MKEIIWTCENCDKKFNLEKDCKVHEKDCKKKTPKSKKIFVKKGIKFIRAGAILFFGQLGLMLLFGFTGSPVIANIFIYGGIGLMLMGLIMLIGGGEEARWVCSKCNKKFAVKSEYLKHEKKCEY